MRETPTSDVNRFWNEQIKETLQLVWNEPRFFFFWLAMLSICGFAAAPIGAALIGQTEFIVAAVVGCNLCFALSVLGFLLAWISPVRRLLEWLLRWRFLVLGCLAALVALFHVVENWRGHRAWQAYKSDREAKGERFDCASLAPPAVPVDQNFFETPPFSDLHFAETTRLPGWDNFRGPFDVSGPRGYRAPGIGDWMNAQRVNLRAWQAFYRSTNNSFPTYIPSTNASAGNDTMAAFRRRYGLASVPPRPAGVWMAPVSFEIGPPTNYFPIAKEPQTPAADVLLALSGFETKRQLLIAASARPQARSWLNYDAGSRMWCPHVSRLENMARYLSFHANVALKAGDRVTALQDVKLTFRLIESVRGEPSLNSHQWRASILRIALQPIWEGLADRQWSEADLGTIGGELGKLDLLADFQRALRGQRAVNLWALDRVRREGIGALEELAAPETQGAWGEMVRSTGLGKLLGPPLFRLVPDGWFDQNKLFSCRLYERYMLPLVNPEQRLVLPAAVRQSSSMGGERIRSPYRFLAKTIVAPLASCVESFAYGQTSVDLARLACALERYRLANGQFPDTLDALVPKFIEKVPHDLINGQPLKYRRTEDGQFVLYSVGWNETDDGGTIGWNKSGGPDWHSGDWVWRYPAK